MSHNLRVALKVAGIVTAGSICGYMSSLWMAEDQDSWYNADYMTEYKCDDNINKLIE